MREPLKEAPSHQFESSDAKEDGVTLFYKSVHFAFSVLHDALGHSHWVVIRQILNVHAYAIKNCPLFFLKTDFCAFNSFSVCIRALKN